ncbi:hypothetical protein FA13DRAFT_1715234 [Coprinellus micaceus]|uniref:Uncharacterized protein n=1 Tax=Coprinellus micaceus TaxID=71717 RepID=A0A4Y7SPB5_COPMI|nr:hypothetical protein FA13DRAFT_1715234 [Coprinellus micaceus]
MQYPQNALWHTRNYPAPSLIRKLENGSGMVQIIILQVYNPLCKWSSRDPEQRRWQRLRAGTGHERPPNPPRPGNPSFLSHQPEHPQNGSNEGAPARAQPTPNGKEVLDRCFQSGEPPRCPVDNASFAECFSLLSTTTISDLGHGLDLPTQFFDDDLDNSEILPTPTGIGETEWATIRISDVAWGYAEISNGVRLRNSDCAWTEEQRVEVLHDTGFLSSTEYPGDAYHA